MATMTYTLSRFVDDLRRIVRATSDTEAVIHQVRPLVVRLGLEKDWLTKQHYCCDEAQGFGIHLLHEEPNHDLAVFAASWLPGRGAPPHNHGTWAVVAGVDGPETNIFWKRLDDGSRPGFAEIRKQGEKVFGPGDVVSFMPNAIHSVVNGTDAVTVSVHVYGRHLNYTDRSQFDPERKTATPFILNVAAT